MNNYNRRPHRSRFDFDRAFVMVWVAALVANLVIWGVAVWAIIELVQWATSK